MFHYRKLLVICGPRLYELFTARTKCRTLSTVLTFQRTGYWKWVFSDLIHFCFGNEPRQCEPDPLTNVYSPSQIIPDLTSRRTERQVLWWPHCGLIQTHSVHNVSGKEEQERAGLSRGRALCFSGSNFGPFRVIVLHKLQICAASLTNGSLLIIRLLGSSASTFLEKPCTCVHASMLRAVFHWDAHACMRCTHKRWHDGLSQACFGKVSCYEINLAAYLLCWHDDGKTKRWEIITGKADCANQPTTHPLFAEPFTCYVDSCAIFSFPTGPIFLQNSRRLIVAKVIAHKIV